MKTKPEIVKQWEKLLVKTRLGRNGPDVPDGRSPFERDSDRIIFSSAFRRLQDKTQVFPLSGSDYVRTRLTHSIEVSVVGRSLGTITGLQLKEKGRLPDGISPADIGAIVASACLAHDIGNPPFGHSGEDAIQHWFNTSSIAKRLKLGFKKKEIADFSRYEGNATGFRVLTRLLHPDSPGLQLTHATLAAIAKYPAEVGLGPNKSAAGASEKKYGFFQTEKSFFTKVATAVGLIRKNQSRLAWYRHPLAFLAEAADDICYLIVDFEDAFRFKLIPFDRLCIAFKEIIADSDIDKKMESIHSEDNKSQYLRARAIGVLVQETAVLFMKMERDILEGKFDKALTEHIPSAAKLAAIRSLMKANVYSTQSIIQVEVAGFEVIAGLLDAFCDSAEDIALNHKKKPSGDASPLSRKIIQLIPSQLISEDKIKNLRSYERTMLIVDFVAGMTDSFAINLYKKVKGISIN
jgi:dGTPase